jgi:hypothetical protein
VLGLLVESQDGRPTKVEGNPRHPNSSGATDVWAQGSVLSLYDPDRCRVPHQLGGRQARRQRLGHRHRGARRDPQDLRGSQGEGLALVLPTVVSPTCRDTLKTFKEKFAKARIFTDDVAAASNAVAGAEMLSVARAPAPPSTCPAPRSSRRSTPTSSADEQDHVRLQREYADGRKHRQPDHAGDMSRLYASSRTSRSPAPRRTTACASAPPGRRPARRRRQRAVRHPQAAPAPRRRGPARRPAQGRARRPEQEKFVVALTKDLNAAKTARRHLAVLVGERQPAWAHALGILVNYALGNGGNTVRLRHDDQAFVSEDDRRARGRPRPTAASPRSSASRPTRPTTPPASSASPRLLKGKVLVHLGSHMDETGKLAPGACPPRTTSSPGATSRPPTRRSRSSSRSSPRCTTASRSLELWPGSPATPRSTATAWSRATGAPRLGAMYSDRCGAAGCTTASSRASPAPAAARPARRGRPGRRARQGRDRRRQVRDQLPPRPEARRRPLRQQRLAARGPAPDDQAGVGQRRLHQHRDRPQARRRELRPAQITVGGRNLVAPVWIAPGQADDTVSLDLGYGRRGLGAVANGAGVDAYALQAAGNPGSSAGAEVAKFGGRRLVYSTQDHGSLDPGVDPASPKDGKYHASACQRGRPGPKGDVATRTARSSARPPSRASRPRTPTSPRRATSSPRRTSSRCGTTTPTPTSAPRPAFVGLQQWGMASTSTAAPAATPARSPARPRTTSRWSAARRSATAARCTGSASTATTPARRRPPRRSSSRCCASTARRPRARTSARSRRPRTAPRASTTWPTTAASAPGTAPTTARTRSGASTSSTTTRTGPTTTSSSACRRTPTSPSASAASSRSAPTACSASRRPRSRPTRPARTWSRTAPSSPPASRCARARPSPSATSPTRTARSRRPRPATSATTASSPTSTPGRAPPTSARVRNPNPELV